MHFLDETERVAETLMDTSSNVDDGGHENFTKAFIHIWVCIFFHYIRFHGSSMPVDITHVACPSQYIHVETRTCIQDVSKMNESFFQIITRVFFSFFFL